MVLFNTSTWIFHTRSNRVNDLITKKEDQVSPTRVMTRSLRLKEVGILFVRVTIFLIVRVYSFSTQIVDVFHAIEI